MSSEAVQHVLSESIDTRIHDKITDKKGAERMFLDNTWHSSISLEKIKPGDILRVRVKEDECDLYFRVTEPSITLEPEEAEREWEKYPFRSRAFARRFGYFPNLLRNLEQVFEIPYSEPPPEMNEKWIEHSRDLSDSSNCQKMKFGATIIRKGKIVSEG